MANYERENTFSRNPNSSRKPLDRSHPFYGPDRVAMDAQAEAERKKPGFWASVRNFFAMDRT